MVKAILPLILSPVVMANPVNLLIVRHIRLIGSKDQQLVDLEEMVNLHEIVVLENIVSGRETSPILPARRSSPGEIERLQVIRAAGAIHDLSVGAEVTVGEVITPSIQHSDPTLPRYLKMDLNRLDQILILKVAPNKPRSRSSQRSQPTILLALIHVHNRFLSV